MKIVKFDNRLDPDKAAHHKHLIWINTICSLVSASKYYVHEVLVNPLGGLSLPRKNVVRLTDHADMTLDVYRGRKTTTQQQQQSLVSEFEHDIQYLFGYKTGFSTL